MGKTDTAYMTYRRRPLGYRLKKYRLLLPLVLIGVVYYFIFNYIPIIWGFMISLKDMKVGSTISNAPWVGLEHYKYVLSDPEMFKLLRNTLQIRILFAFFSESGFINVLIGKLGGSTYPFMTSSKAFVPLLVGSQVWKEAGWGTILYFAALTGVNPELYEAAKIDGAGPLARIKAVTLPAMVPVISFSLIMAMGNILNSDFEQILLFYNASVFDVADVIDTWVYRIGLGRMQYGVGSAVSMMKAVVSLVLILIANSTSRKVAGRGMF